MDAPLWTSTKCPGAADRKRPLEAIFCRRYWSWTPGIRTSVPGGADHHRQRRRRVPGEDLRVGPPPLAASGSLDGDPLGRGHGEQLPGPELQLGLCCIPCRTTARKSASVRTGCPLTATRRCSTRPRGSGRAATSAKTWVTTTWSAAFSCGVMSATRTRRPPTGARCPASTLQKQHPNRRSGRSHGRARP